MVKGKHKNFRQEKIFLDFMEKHPDIAKGFTKRDKYTIDAKWCNLEKDLNGEGPPIKDLLVGKKHGLIGKRTSKKTSRGPDNTLPITATEDSIAILTGMYTAVSGIKNTVSFGDEIGITETPFEETSNKTNEVFVCEDNDISINVPEELLSLSETPKRRNGISENVAKHIENQKTVLLEISKDIKNQSEITKENKNSFERTYRGIEKLGDALRDQNKMLKEKTETKNRYYTEMEQIAKEKISIHTDLLKQKMISEENYIISQARNSLDKYTAKAWILTAKTLFPKNFNVQFEAYKLEKNASNFLEAAKCFNYVILTFQNQPIELWNEVAKLTSSLRVPEKEITGEQEFYVKMFENVSNDVQHKILLLTVNNTENSLEQCKFMLLLLKRFPQAIATHSPQLLEMVAQGMVSQCPEKYQEMLVEEILPLIYNKTPDLPCNLVCRIFSISLEYYTNKIFEKEDSKISSYDVWKQIFQVLTLCGKIMNWEPFLPFNKTWSKDVYWQKLIEIATTNPARTSENKQIFFYTVTLFIFSLHEYNININQKINDIDIEFALVEGFREWTKESTSIRAIEQPMEPPTISVSPPCTKEATIAFATAAHSWQLLNSHEQSTIEISQLLIKLPLSNWFSRFIHDLAVYFGHSEEAKKLLNDIDGCTGLGFNIRCLGLILNQGQLTIQGFQCILKILQELPQVFGNLVEDISIIGNQRHLLLLPLTQTAVIQYCTKAIINRLARKIFEPNCSDLILGNLLILAQLEYPRERSLVEQIFTLIKSRRSFSYLLFPTYIIVLDFIEEIMHIWNSNEGDFLLEFTTAQCAVGGTRRIGTRGADKGVKEDFKLIIKQQITRRHENIPTLVAKFIEQEHLNLIQTMF